MLDVDDMAADAFQVAEMDRRTKAPTHGLRFLRRLADELDRLLEPYGLQLNMSAAGAIARGHELLRDEVNVASPVWSPHVDVFERDDQYVIRADLPGVREDDFTLEVHDGALWIEGERRADPQDARCGFRCRGCRGGRFCRAVPLPDGGTLDRAVVHLHDGVLEVSLPLPRTAPRPPRARDDRPPVRPQSVDPMSRQISSPTNPERSTA